MPFSQIRGQEQAIEGLTSSLAQNRVAHAYLFIGPQGVGKKTTALAFAEALGCVEVKYVFSQGGSIKIEQIRQLQREVYLRPYNGKKKVYIFAEAEKMTEEASNSLLKILEEPPNYAIIILLTAYPYSLLATIRSRCQLVSFQPLKQNLIEEILTGRLPEETEKVQIVARLCNGSLEKAFLLAKEEDLWEKRNILWSLINDLSLGKRENFIKEAEKLDKEGREKIQENLELLSTCYRDILIWQATQETAFLINSDRLEDIKNLGSLLSFRELTEANHLVQETKGLIKKNANSRLALEVLFLKLSKRAEDGKCIQ